MHVQLEPRAILLVSDILLRSTAFLGYDPVNGDAEGWQLHLLDKLTNFNLAPVWPYWYSSVREETLSVSFPPPGARKPWTFFSEVAIG
jgi:hypothetical protein